MRVFLLIVFLATTLGTWARPIVRESGVIYLSDFSLPVIKLTLREAAPCYFQLDGRRYAGTLRFPQVVTLDAVAPNGMLRIRGNAQQGGVAAWVEPHFFEGMPPHFIENLQRSEARRQQVEKLIENNEVAIGMTPEEVTRSLGRPQKRSSRTERDGSTQTLEYIRYKLVPQTIFTPTYASTITGYRPEPGGRLETVTMRNTSGMGASTVFVKVPVGTTTVHFSQGVVESIEESEGTLTGARSSIVVPPINLRW